jgi:hypothetical protein
MQRLRFWEDKYNILKSQILASNSTQAYLSHDSRCIHMYVNVKMIPVETVPVIRERGDRAVEGTNSSMTYLMHCKKLCKCYNVPPPSTTIK